MNLYRVTTRKGSGMYGECYALAQSADAAYKKVRKYLDDKDLCFSKERELAKVELVAGPPDYPDCEKLIFV